MNKAELVDALAERLGGDHQIATSALENTLDIIVRTVAMGESITVMGFGIFERRDRAARTARNPHTGESIPVPSTTVPAFRPGQFFKDVIKGDLELAPVGLAVKRASSHQGFGQALVDVDVMQAAGRPAAARRVTGERSRSPVTLG